MRRWLQLAATVSSLLVAVAGRPATAAAQPRDAGDGSVDAKGSVYADDDSTQVWTALANGEVWLPERARLGVHALVDVISTASVDVVSAATQRFDEVRIEEGGRVGMYVTPEVDLGASFTHSQENDWQSFAPSGTASIDLFKRNTNITAGYGYVHNRVGRAEDPNFEERLQSHTGELSVTQVLDARSLLSVSYTLQGSMGYQSSPYRYVTTTGGSSVLEHHPDRRLRHAITTTGLRYIVRGVGLEASYRFYIDDWGVNSHTASAGLRLDIIDRIDLRLRARGYYQVAADFWREHYDEPLAYMSLDRELSTFWDAGGGLKLGYHDDTWTVAAKLDGLYYRFLDFSRLRGRLGLVADLGAGVRW